MVEQFLEQELKRTRIRINKTEFLLMKAAERQQQPQQEQHPKFEEWHGYVKKASKSNVNNAKKPAKQFVPPQLVPSSTTKSNGNNNSHHHPHNQQFIVDSTKATINNNHHNNERRHSSSVIDPNKAEINFVANNKFPSVKSVENNDQKDAHLNNQGTKRTARKTKQLNYFDRQQYAHIQNGLVDAVSVAPQQQPSLQSNQVFKTNQNQQQQHQQQQQQPPLQPDLNQPVIDLIIGGRNKIMNQKNTSRRWESSRTSKTFKKDINGGMSSGNSKYSKDVARAMQAYSLCDFEKMSNSFNNQRNKNNNIANEGQQMKRQQSRHMLNSYSVVSNDQASGSGTANKRTMLPQVSQKRDLSNSSPIKQVFSYDPQAINFLEKQNSSAILMDGGAAFSKTPDSTKQNRELYKSPGNINNKFTSQMLIQNMTTTLADEAMDEQQDVSPVPIIRKKQHTVDSNMLMGNGGNQITSQMYLTEEQRLKQIQAAAANCQPLYKNQQQRIPTTMNHTPSSASITPINATQVRQSAYDQLLEMQKVKQDKLGFELKQQLQREREKEKYQDNGCSPIYGQQSTTPMIGSPSVKRRLANSKKIDLSPYNTRDVSSKHINEDNKITANVSLDYRSCVFESLDNTRVINHKKLIPTSRPLRNTNSTKQNSNTELIHVTSQSNHHQQQQPDQLVKQKQYYSQVNSRRQYINAKTQNNNQQPLKTSDKELIKQHHIQNVLVTQTSSDSLVRKTEPEIKQNGNQHITEQDQLQQQQQQQTNPQVTQDNFKVTSLNNNITNLNNMTEDTTGEQPKSNIFVIQKLLDSSTINFDDTKESRMLAQLQKNLTGAKDAQIPLNTASHHLQMMRTKKRRARLNYLSNLSKNYQKEEQKTLNQCGAEVQIDITKMQLHKSNEKLRTSVSSQNSRSQNMLKTLDDNKQCKNQSKQIEKINQEVQQVVQDHLAQQEQVNSVQKLVLTVQKESAKKVSVDISLVNCPLKKELPIPENKKENINSPANGSVVNPLTNKYLAANQTDVQDKVQQSMPQTQHPRQHSNLKPVLNSVNPISLTGGADSNKQALNKSVPCSATPQNNNQSKKPSLTSQISTSKQQQQQQQTQNKKANTSDQNTTSPPQQPTNKDDQQPKVNNNTEITLKKQQSSQPAAQQGNKQEEPRQETRQVFKKQTYLNPNHIADQERERVIQLKIEAAEKAKEYSKNNRQIGKYKYAIKGGNNGDLLSTCMQLRSERWQETSSFDKLFNFKWQPISRGINFEMLGNFGVKQLVNHFSNHQSLSTKDQLFQNLSVYCESQKQNVFDLMPITFVIQTYQTDFVQQLDRFCNYFSEIDKLIKSEEMSSDLEQNEDILDEMLKKVNNKAYENAIKYYQSKQKSYQQTSNKIIIPKCFFKGKNVWILKVTGFNRGVGIHVFDRLDELQRLISEYTDGLNSSIKDDVWRARKIFDRQIQENTDDKDKGSGGPTADQPEIQKEQAIDNNKPDKDKSNGNDAQDKQQTSVSNIKSASFVIQKYMEDPMLIQQRKFDIRVWVLITQDCKVHVFREGYIRTSSSTFNLDTQQISSPEIHLTNNAVQYKMKDYGKFEEANMLSYSQFQSYLNSLDNKYEQNCVQEKLMPDMIEKIIASLESVKGTLGLEKSCMELFGYDFLVDNDLQTWLIEVNTNPSLCESGSYIKGLLRRMINDMLRLTVDCTFLPKKGMGAYDEKALNCFPVEGYEDTANLWETIFNLKTGQRPPKLI